MKQISPDNEKKRPIKVLHLINDLGCGGAQEIIFNLVREMDKKMFFPIVGFWGNKFGSKLIEKFLDSNIKVVDFKAKNKFDVTSIARLTKYLSTNSITILHTHLFLMHIMGRISGKAARTPWIVSTHHNFRKSNNLVSRLFEKITSPLSHATTYVSRAAQETYLTSSVAFSVDALRSGQKHFTIYNSVNAEKINHLIRNVDIEQTRRELGLRDEYVFACVGRLHSSKGHTYLIEAMDYLRETHPSIRLLIVGDGVLKNELIEKTSARGLFGHIRFLGYREDIYRILAVSNALIQPSIFEGFGLASAEAMACGLPVVSTNLPSIAEVVLHEKTGILVPPGDSQALSKAMAYLMDHPKLAMIYGANGKRRVEELFSTEVITQQYESLYQELIASKFAI